MAAGESVFGDGGNTQIQTGASPEAASGNLVLKSSDGTRSGDVAIFSGTANSAESGSLQLSTGASGGQAGSLSLSVGSSASGAGSDIIVATDSKSGGSVLVQSGENIKLASSSALSFALAFVTRIASCSAR